MIVIVIMMTCASKQGCGLPLSGASWTRMGPASHTTPGDDDEDDEYDGDGDADADADADDDAWDQLLTQL